MGGEEDREVHHSWLVHDQDAHEACQEGRYKGSLRQDHQSEGCTRQEDCEGILRLRFEEEHLKWIASGNCCLPGIQTWNQLWVWGCLHLLSAGASVCPGSSSG